MTDKEKQRLEEILDANKDGSIDLKDSSKLFKSGKWFLGILAGLIWVVAQLAPMILKLIGII